MVVIDLSSRYSIPVQFILSCLNVSGDKKSLVAIDQIPPSDWETIEMLAYRHMISPVIYMHLKKENMLSGIPPSVQTRLREDYLSTIYQNTHLYGTLVRLINVFKQNNIPVMILKGAYLADKVYGNIGLRKMGDIDLLIPRQKLSNAYQIAINTGYTPSFNFDVEEEINHRHSLPPIYSPGKTEIDMHWALFPPELPFHFNETSLWTQSKQDTVYGATVNSLRPEHLLLHLCFHFAYMHRHAGQLFQVNDITQVLIHFQNGLDWQYLADLAASWGMRKPTFLALSTASCLLDAPVPDQFLAEIQPEDYKPEYLDWLIDQMLETQSYSVNLAGLLTANSFRNRLNLFVKGIFWPPRIMRERYPRLAHGFGLPLAYLLRIMDVARRQLPRAWKLARKDSAAQEAANQVKRVEIVGRWMESI